MRRRRRSLRHLGVVGVSPIISHQWQTMCLRDAVLSYLCLSVAAAISAEILLRKCLCFLFHTSISLTQTHTHPPPPQLLLPSYLWCSRISAFNAPKQAHALCNKQGGGFNHIWRMMRNLRHVLNLDQVHSHFSRVVRLFISYHPMTSRCCWAEELHGNYSCDSCLSVSCSALKSSRSAEHWRRFVVGSLSARHACSLC